MKLFLYILACIFVLEILTTIIVNWIRKKFQWLITSKDEYPILDKDGLNKFILFGYDSGLGWIRKPNTSHEEKGKYGITCYHIDSNGSRKNPANKNLNSEIVCFGDSFTFCRQVNDDETWEYYLSELSHLDVLNFGVGNYGLDQAYLRLEREIKNINPKILLMGVVPSTIVRVLCVWKHYNEYGNTFGFKPRFELVDGELVLIKNFIDDESKFFIYKNYLDDIQRNDFFYRTKFKKEIIHFPYLYYTLKNPDRNLKIISAVILNEFLKIFGIKNNRIADYPHQEIMKINLKLREKLFSDKHALNLLIEITKKFVELSEKENFIPVFILLPQKDDVLLVKKGGNYYEHFINELNKKLLVIDLTVPLTKVNKLDFLYSEDGIYGGHFSKDGNKVVAEYIFEKLKEKNFIN